ncbi:hypothetical protein KC332_g84 [Hortaea werneckii]|nr:hypothetical protein KC348_g91 [Hortaea werneckii]KAI7421894.1 hypothetical protein KC332_g84 [Hortaea werneckii]
MIHASICCISLQWQPHPILPRRFERLVRWLRSPIVIATSRGRLLCARKLDSTSIVAIGCVSAERVSKARPQDRAGIRVPCQRAAAIRRFGEQMK